MANRNPIARGAIARALSFVPTAIATLLTSRLIIGEFGIASFNSYALILSLIALLTLNNLGVGAAVTQAYATDGPQAKHSQHVAHRSASARHLQRRDGDHRAAVGRPWAVG